MATKKFAQLPIVTSSGSTLLSVRQSIVLNIRPQNFLPPHVALQSVFLTIPRSFRSPRKKETGSSNQLCSKARKKGSQTIDLVSCQWHPSLMLTKASEISTRTSVYSCSARLQKSVACKFSLIILFLKNKFAGFCWHSDTYSLITYIKITSS